MSVRRAFQRFQPFQQMPQMGQQPFQQPFQHAPQMGQQPFQRPARKIKAKILIAAALLILVIIVVVIILINTADGDGDGNFNPPPTDSNFNPPPTNNEYIQWTATPNNKILSDPAVTNNRYVCVAEYKGVLHPGKTNSDKCNISYEDKEYSISDFKYLDTNKIVNWTTSPKNKVEATQHNGTPVYVCRSKMANGYHAGKAIQPGICNVPYGGKEYNQKDYEFLSLD